MTLRRPHLLKHVVSLSVSLWFASGCGYVEEPPKDAVCVGAPSCEVTFGSYITQENPLGPDQTLVVRGSCENGGIAIRQVSFAGQIMDNPAHNYEHWETSLEYAFITTYDEGDGIAELPFSAIDACGESTVFPPVLVWLEVDDRAD